MHTCWSPLTTELVTSTEYMAVMKSHHSPPPPLFLLPTLYMRRGVRRVCGVDEADCARVSEAAVLAEEEREAVSLRIRPARLASSRLPGSLKLFDDRTGQHHRRWGRRVLVVVGYGSLSFVYSCFFHLVQLPSSSSHLLYLFLYPLLFYFSVAVAVLRLRDPFKLFKEVVCCSQAPGPAARRARAGCRKRK